MKKSELGKFGSQVEFYEKARRVYPKEVFRFLKTKTRGNDLKILDLGCGTGISTRQLAKMKIGEVIGCDPDKIMIAHAKKHGISGVKRYVRALAADLPFKDEEFDVVTSFSAFHWFDDNKSLNEIRRVLKPGGVFFVAGREGVKSWGEGYRQSIMKATGKAVAQFMKARGFDPVHSIKKAGFNGVEKKTWKKSETYTLKGAIDYVQSVSIWKSVPTHLKEKALAGLEQYFKKIQKDKGKIVRILKVYVILGFK